MTTFARAITPEDVEGVVLVADDNPENRALAQATLEDEGYTVILAHDGHEAVARFQEKEPDCVLMDVRMPGLDGIGACKAIRALEAGKRTPILFVTALRDVDTFDGAILAGGDDFLSKPIRPTELLTRVSAAIKYKQIGEELREQLEVVREQRNALLRLQLQKERLMAFVVHDLKNPVNAIDMHAQLLLRDPKLSDGAKQTARSIRESTRTLLRLTLNLLDLSKEEEGALQVHARPLVLRELIDGLLEEFHGAAAGRNVKLVSDLRATHARVDGDLLRRSLENLIDNALRHAPKGSTVTVAANPEGNTLLLSVSDQGPGLDAQLRGVVFDRFAQGPDGGYVSRSGRGLGLAFCKLVAIAHQGAIGVEDLQPGASFWMRLPHVIEGAA